eukprot:scaffold639_cov304-Pinguiococcus_pyrenoidosus.AAC.9
MQPRRAQAAGPDLLEVAVPQDTVPYVRPRGRSGCNHSPQNLVELLRLDHYEPCGFLGVARTLLARQLHQRPAIVEKVQGVAMAFYTTLCR